MKYLLLPVLCLLIFYINAMERAVEITNPHSFPCRFDYCIKYQRRYLSAYEIIQPGKTIILEASSTHIPIQNKKNKKLLIKPTVVTNKK